MKIAIAALAIALALGACKHTIEYKPESSGAQW